MIQGYDDDHAMGGGDPVSATVKWFNPVKGFGFVQRGDGSPDAFLHISVVEQCEHRDLPEGTRITCNIAEGRKGLQVTQILSVDELAAPPARPSGPPVGGGGGGAGSVVEGTVKFFNPEKGFGFVIPDDGGKDVFVSARSLERTGLMNLEPNQRVRVTIRMGQKGPMADSVEPV